MLLFALYSYVQAVMIATNTQSFMDSLSFIFQFDSGTLIHSYVYYEFLVMMLAAFGRPWHFSAPCS